MPCVLWTHLHLVILTYLPGSVVNDRAWWHRHKKKEAYYLRLSLRWWFVVHVWAMVCVCVCRGEGLRACVRLQSARAPLCGEHEGQRAERQRKTGDPRHLAQASGQTYAVLLYWQDVYIHYNVQICTVIGHCVGIPCFIYFYIDKAELIVIINVPVSQMANCCPWVSSYKKINHQH